MGVGVVSKFWTHDLKHPKVHFAPHLLVVSLQLVPSLPALSTGNLQWNLTLLLHHLFRSPFTRACRGTIAQCFFVQFGFEGFETIN